MDGFPVDQNDRNAGCILGFVLKLCVVNRREEVKIIGDIGKGIDGPESWGCNRIDHGDQCGTGVTVL